MLSLLFLLFLLTPSAAFAATRCEDLARLSIPNTTITLAQQVETGAFTPPAAAAGRGGAAAPNPFANLPAFCRVQATLRPSSDSDIKMELWMPVAASWNGKFRGTGNGGLGGGAAVNANPLANGVRLGYATAGSNTGHEGDSSYAIDHPKKIKDFGYRSAHDCLSKPQADAAMKITTRTECPWENVCQYPKVPTYKGSGNTEDAASFVCK